MIIDHCNLQVPNLKAEQELGMFNAHRKVGIKYIPLGKVKISPNNIRKAMIMKKDHTISSVDLIGKLMASFSRNYRRNQFRSIPKHLNLKVLFLS